MKIQLTAERLSAKMTTRTHRLPVVLLVICLHLARGYSAINHPALVDAGDDELSLPLYKPKTIDEVATNAEEGRAAGRLGEHNDGILDGMDMGLSSEQFARLYLGVRGRSTQRTAGKPWPNGVIPYEIKKGDFSDTQKSWIQTAMEKWENVSCVDFRPANSSDKYKIVISNGKTCMADLGFEKKERSVSLDTLCFWKGTIEHEFGHALGLIHEHQRPNRDAYIKVNYYNVAVDLIGQLVKYARGSDDKMGLEYDYTSVMHYKKDAFDKIEKTQTIFPRDATKTDVIGMTLGPSFLDAKLVNLMYKCADRCKEPPTSPPCPNECFITADCECFCSKDMPKEVCKDKADCADRAKKGDCVLWQTYMHTFCRKSCGICKDDGTIPHLKCMDIDKDCDNRTLQGDCANNATYMRKHCQVACGVCKEKEDYSLQGGCNDTNSTCKQLAADGKCNKFTESMLRDCRESCDFCLKDIGEDPSNKTGCADFDTVCQYNKDRGYCTKLEVLMSTHCPEQCGKCNANVTVSANCTDSRVKCPTWAIGGECDLNKSWMESNCNKSCGVCK